MLNRPLDQTLSAVEFRMIRKLNPRQSTMR